VEREMECNKEREWGEEGERAIEKWREKEGLER
jgi:hypothetical protein